MSEDRILNEQAPHRDHLRVLAADASSKAAKAVYLRWLAELRARHAADQGKGPARPS